MTWATRHRGAAVAGAVLTAWAGALALTLGSVRWPEHPGAAGILLRLLPIPLLTFLYTGLFITAHDAMHGTISPGHPRLNRAIGRLCVFLYAAFSFGRLEREHRRHHALPASAEDPDFHGPGDPSWPRWYLRFMVHYLTVPQLLAMALVAQALQRGLGVPFLNLALYWMAPSLLSTLQLFHFGTYLPHREREGGYADRHRARSNDYPEWLSLLTCYHFGYHHEHHVAPHVPWWGLPAHRAGQSSFGPFSGPIAPRSSKT